MPDLEPLDLPVPEDDREAANLIVARPIRMKPKQASAQIAALAGDVTAGKVVQGEWEVFGDGDPADADDRVLGTELAGEIARMRIFKGGPPSTADTLAKLHFNGGSVGGQGLGAFNVYGVDITVEGGAQDGVAKTMLGGKVAVMKGENRLGRRGNGAGGESFCFRAPRGRPFVEGGAGP